MNNEEVRDFVTIKDENGVEKEYSIEALFDMEEETYALLQSNGETLLIVSKTKVMSNTLLDYLTLRSGSLLWTPIRLL